MPIGLRTCRAKGRQWPEVQLFACEERQLPHHHAASRFLTEAGLEPVQPYQPPAPRRASMTLTKLLAAVEQLTDAQRRALLAAADVEVPVRRLDATSRPWLVRALRDLTSPSRS
jgi:hypothetical protein